MRLIAKKTLREFWQNHKDCEKSLLIWYNKIKLAKWNNSNELKKQFPNASIINDLRVVFNIKGNKYRIVVEVDFDYKFIFVIWLGTHSEYDKINVKTIQYENK